MTPPQPPPHPGEASGTAAGTAALALTRGSGEGGQARSEGRHRPPDAGVKEGGKARTGGCPCEVTSQVTQPAGLLPAAKCHEPGWPPPL